jgi:hypothetical protein
MLAAIGVIEIGIAGFDRHLAAIGHRVARIDRKIQDNAFKFWTVGLDRPHAGAPHNLDRDVLADAPSEEIGHAVQKPVDVDRCWIERLLSRERQ